MTRAPQFSLRALLLCFVGIATLLVIARSISRSAWWNGGVHPISFDVEEWLRAEQIEDYRTVRSQMIEDLLKRFDFRGWSRGEVTKLLGKPDWDPKTSGFPSWDIAYYLGRERGGAFSLDIECLVFRFDGSDLVTEYRTAVN